MEYYDIDTAQINFHATAYQITRAILKDVENRIYNGLKTKYIIVDHRFAMCFEKLIEQEISQKQSNLNYFEQWPFRGNKFFDYEVIECENLEINTPLGKVTVWWMLG